MSKSIIVIDTPNCCLECPLHYRSEDILLGNFTYQMTWGCKIKPIDIEDGYITNIIDNIPEWCPLLPLPECKELITNTNGEANIGNILQYNYAQGYNDCLKDIQKGETNEKM